MNEFTITLNGMEALQHFFSIVVVSFLAGFAFAKFLIKRDVKISTIDDTCQVTMLNKFGNRPYIIKKFYIDDKCKDVVCDFLEDKKTCSYNRRNNKNNKRCNYL